jgi:hypothetical protein
VQCSGEWSSLQLIDRPAASCTTYVICSVVSSALLAVDILTGALHTIARILVCGRGAEEPACTSYVDRSVKLSQSMLSCRVLTCVQAAHAWCPQHHHQHPAVTRVTHSLSLSLYLDREPCMDDGRLLLHARCAYATPRLLATSELDLTAVPTDWLSFVRCGRSITSCCWIRGRSINRWIDR